MIGVRPEYFPASHLRVPYLNLFLSYLSNFARVKVQHFHFLTRQRWLTCECQRANGLEQPDVSKVLEGAAKEAVARHRAHGRLTRTRQQAHVAPTGGIGSARVFRR